MIKRSDIHRPSAIIPTDYEYVGITHGPVTAYDDHHFILLMRAQVKAHMDRTGGTYSGHDHGGKCHICGAWFNCGVVFYHSKTNAYIKTGEDCAEKLEFAGYKGDLKAFRTAVKVSTELKAGKKKAEATLTDLGLVQAWTLYKEAESIYSRRRANDPTVTKDEVKYEEATIHDIIGKLVKYGTISEAQRLYVEKLVERFNTRDEREAEAARIDAEKLANRKPAPEGRLVITGTVLGMKAVENMFARNAETLKALIETSDGWKIWVTVPSAAGWEKGQEVRIKVSVIPSTKDPYFAFGKRPSVIKEDS